MRVQGLAVVMLLAASGAQAAPGVGEKIYGASVERGVTEVEARYGRLTGGTDNGEDGLVLELAHGFSDRFYGALLGEFERAPGSGRKFGSLGAEAILTTGRIEALGIDTALYAEFAAVRGGPDKLETKLLLERRAGGFDGRVNLIAEKLLAGGNRVNFGYAASADWHVVGEIRAGVAAFGEFGDIHSFASRNEHFLGPVIKAAIEHLPGGSEIEIETGWLRAFGAARDDTNGQFRLLLEWETHF